MEALATVVEEVAGTFKPKGVVKVFTLCLVFSASVLRLDFAGTGLEVFEMIKPD